MVFKEAEQENAQASPVRRLPFLEPQQENNFALLKKKPEKGLLSVLSRLLEHSGKASLESRIIRKTIKDKGYEEWLSKNGVKKDSDGGYQASRGKTVKGRAYKYEITLGIAEIPGNLGDAVKVFMKLSCEERTAVIRAYGNPFALAYFMPHMMALAKENGVKTPKIRLKYGNYYGGSSNLKLRKCQPGMVEIDVHAMNPFSLSLLIQGQENASERKHFLSLFQGRGFYDNVRILCGATETSLGAFKKSFLRNANRRDTFRLAEPSAEDAQRFSQQSQERARLEFERKQQRPASAAKQSMLRGLRARGEEPPIPTKEEFSYFEPPPPEYDPALTWLSQEFPVMWRKFCRMLKNKEPSQMSKTFYLYHQGCLMGAACRAMEQRKIGVCQKHDAIVMRTKNPGDVKALVKTIRNNAQEIYEAQPVLRAKFSPGTSEADQDAIRDLCPDLFCPDNSETLDPGDFW